jgi:patatin-related protein
MAAGGARQIRLAFVLYGGVSLAVYMHGVCREIQELIVGSRARERGEAAKLPPGTAAQAYATVIKERSKADGSFVSISADIIAGTSAGGIDGVYLAKALAGNLSQAPLRDLWIHQGDLHKLLTGRGPVWLRLLFFTGRVLPGNKPLAPLKGSWMTRRLLKGLQEMERTGSRPYGGRTLISEGQGLDLFITVTDGSGYERFTTVVPGGPTIRDTTHRHVLHFTASARDDASSQFNTGHNTALTFAARATSSFPGAFPPVTIDEFIQDLNLQDGSFNVEEFAKDFFPEYVSWGDDPRRTWFIDGGVLDNFPFASALSAIDRRSADSEVERHLVYVEPHPTVSPPAGSPRDAFPGQTESKRPAPGWFETVVSAVSSIPSHEPILDEIFALRDRNERITRIRALARDHLPEIQAELDRNEVWQEAKARGSKIEYHAVTEVTRDMHKVADKRLGLGLDVYLTLRLQDIAEHLSTVMAQAFTYPETSSAAAFIKEGLNLWLPFSSQMPQTASFLSRYDIGFRQRRLSFLIQGLNLLYTESQPPGFREQVDAAKGTLYKHVEKLWDIPLQMGKDLQAASGPLFSPESLGPWLSQTPQQFADAKSEELEFLLAEVGSWLDTYLADFGRTLWDAIQNQTWDWPDEQREYSDSIFTRFVGFPLWDGISFPLVALSGVEQSTQINVNRISPLDATALRWQEPKLRGTNLHNFAGFLNRDWRENDYLWGRLDAAEMLTRLINSDLAEKDLFAALQTAFTAVLTEEQDLDILKTNWEHIRTRLTERIDNLKTSEK